MNPALDSLATETRAGFQLVKGDYGIKRFL